MTFPEVERVIYAQKPLREVVCQLRFPPILKIDSELPARFQESIRTYFPDFTESVEQRFELPIIPMLQSSFESLVRMGETKNYHFSTKNQEWQINLTRDFLALTARNYETREKFAATLKAPLAALEEIYEPAYYVRIGMRYIDVINPAALGLENVAWRQLFRNHILGVLGEESISSNVFEFQNSFVVKLDDGESQVRVLTSLEKPESHTVAFKIDSDFYVEGEVDRSSAREKLAYFASLGFRLFRWCITDQLHEALEPGQIS